VYVHKLNEEFVMGDKKSRGFIPRAIDVGTSDDAYGSSDDPYDCMPSIKRHTSIDGPPIDEWLADAYAKLPPADMPLTRMIPPGSRRY
jgi:hypothetical protein